MRPVNACFEEFHTFSNVRRVQQLIGEWCDKYTIRFRTNSGTTIWTALSMMDLRTKRPRWITLDSKSGWPTQSFAVMQNWLEACLSRNSHLDSSTIIDSFDVVKVNGLMSSLDLLLAMVCLCQFHRSLLLRVMQGRVRSVLSFLLLWVDEKDHRQPDCFYQHDGWQQIRIQIEENTSKQTYLCCPLYQESTSAGLDLFEWSIYFPLYMDLKVAHTIWWRGTYFMWWHISDRRLRTTFANTRMAFWFHCLVAAKVRISAGWCRRKC